MDQVNVGSCGLRVSRVGLGCNSFGWNIDAEASGQVMRRAMDLGVTLLDMADYYGSSFGATEEIVGQYIEGRRDDLVLVTKFGLRKDAPPDNSRRYMMRAVEESLRRLRTDRIDLYMLHWPDLHTPTEEIVRGLHDLITSGKVLYVGCSNLPPWRVVEARSIARELRSHAFIAVEEEYSLVARGVEKEMLPLCRQNGMGLLPYLPLAGGLLTGKYLQQGAEGRLKDNFLQLGNQFLNERNLDIVRRLDMFVKKRGKSLIELAMSWLAAQPVVTGIIAGASRPEQVEQNVAAVNWRLTDEELKVVDEILG